MTKPIASSIIIVYEGINEIEYRCPKCKNPISTYGGRFCPYCGTEMDFNVVKRVSGNLENCDTAKIIKEIQQFNAKDNQEVNETYYYSGE